jgi:hypothetical protein
VHTPPPQTATFGPDAWLKRAHRLALIAIAGCAVVAAIADGTPDAPPDRTLTTGGVALALVCVLSRRFSVSPVMRERARVLLGSVSLAAAVGVAAIGAVIPWQGGDIRQGVAFAGGAALLCLRRPRIGSS